jgi:hypothetical protein
VCIPRKEKKRKEKKRTGQKKNTKVLKTNDRYAESASMEWELIILG